jgi:hypothetical protein
MSVRGVLKLFVLSLLAFAAAFAVRRTFLWDVMPVSWDQEAQPLWALASAFLLRSIENLSAAVAIIALVLAAGLAIDHWRLAHPPKLRSSK